MSVRWGAHLLTVEAKPQNKHLRLQQIASHSEPINPHKNGKQERKKTKVESDEFLEFGQFMKAGKIKI